mmetsp:Transcript_3818/g.6298  ORF Transcript_3818/g.6298 Transcript_3818/m.6298 type:complete len:152 (+) Transcript_3818:92-547(+)|eukprot:scaffold2929_cov145-Skeletonema_menzelii.AAC.10
MMKVTPLLFTVLAVLSAVPRAISVEEQSNYSFNDQVEGLVGEDDDVPDPCDSQINAVVTCFGGVEAINSLDDDKFYILDDIDEYFYFVDVLYNETTDEVVDMYIDCETVNQEDCDLVLTDIKSIGKCESELTALFKCRDSDENGGCNKCQG